MDNAEKMSDDKVEAIKKILDSKVQHIDSTWEESQLIVRIFNDFIDIARNSCIIIIANDCFNDSFLV